MRRLGVTIIVALLLLALPLAAQSPVGVWTTTVERTVQGVPVTDAGVIIFRADGAYTSARKWSWTEDGVRTGAYAYSEGRWTLTGDTLCVTSDDRALPNCHPVAVTDSTLVWGGFTFRRGE